MTTLFIAEKPSMARELARCLPPPQQRGNGFIRTGGGIVTWAYGHVLQQAEPQDYDGRYKMWRAEDLPIIPQTWKLLVSPASKDSSGSSASSSNRRIRWSTPATRTGKGSCSSMKYWTISAIQSQSGASSSMPSMKKAFMSPWRICGITAISAT